MQAFSSDELARMQGAQESAMQDTCIVYTYAAGATNALGHAAAGYTAQTAQPCGYKPNATREANDGGEVALVDAVLRLAIDATIGEHDRVKVTKRFGVTLTDQPLYEVVGIPARGPSGLVVNLQRVTDA